MPSVELHHIIKSFASLRAVNDVSLTIAPGTVHGLLGENGAGKTTLMNILYGMVQRDGGELRIDGPAAQINSPGDAIANGSGMVHEHLMLAGGQERGVHQAQIARSSEHLRSADGGSRGTGCLGGLE